MPLNDVYSSTNTRPDSPDQLLWAGMGYGTPHHNYMLGTQANGVANNALAPVQNPNGFYPAAYTNLFRQASADPLLAYGLDMSRIGLVPQSQWQRDDLAYYSPSRDQGGAAIPPDMNTDSVAHEHLHRNINAMTRDPAATGMMGNALASHLSLQQNPFGVVGQRHHAIIGQALPNTEDYRDDPEALARYRALQAIATRRNHEMRSPMGPR